MNSFRLVCIFSFILTFSSLSFAQTGNAYLQTEPDIIYAGEVFQFSIVVENLEVQSPGYIRFDPFLQLQGPSSSSSMSIINGRRSSTMTWIYMLKAPDKPGTYKIKPLKLKSASGIIQTSGLDIEIRSSDQKSKRAGSVKADGDFFVKLETGVKTAYPGQQILLQCRLYTSVNISSYEFLNEPNIQDAFIQKSENRQSPVEELSINGKKYISKVLRTYAIYPQQSGQFNIPSIAIKFALDDDTGRQSNWGVFFKNYRFENAQTEPVSIEVLDLPLPAPPDFTGAVGSYQADLRPVIQSASANEETGFVLSIKGEGDLKRINQAKLRWPDSFKLFGTKTTREEYLEGTESISGIKEFAYTLVPDSAGTFDIKNVFVYFDPVAQQYDSLPLNIPSFRVEEGSKHISGNAVIERFDSTEQGLLETLQDSSAALYTGLGILCLLVFAVIYSNRRKSQNSIKTQKTIRELEKECLKKSFSSAKQGQEDLFYLEISRILYRFAGRKTGKDHALLTRKEVNDFLEREEMKEQDKIKVRQLLDRCEQYLYAPLSITTPLEESCQQMEDLIDTYF